MLKAFSVVTDTFVSSRYKHILLEEVYITFLGKMQNCFILESKYGI